MSQRAKHDFKAMNPIAVTSRQQSIPTTLSSSIDQMLTTAHGDQATASSTNVRVSLMDE
jgi:hypothetical protein